MNKHNNMYNILGKLSALQPKEEPVKKDSVLKTLTEHSNSLVTKLNNKYQESKQLNEYFEFDTKPKKDRGPRDTSTDELARREKTLGKGGLGKGKPFGQEYKQKGNYGNAYDIAGPKGVLPENMTDEDMIVAKKDYDGDGKKESPADEYKGSKDKAIKKAMGKRDLTDEGAKPDYLDLDKDGNKKEPMKKAAKEVDEGVYDDSVNKSKVPAYQRKAKGGDWKVSAADLDAEKEKNISDPVNMAKRSGKSDAQVNALRQQHGRSAVDEVKMADLKGTVHKGTYGTDAYDAGSEDDYDEWGNEKKGAKKAASGDAPKKRGRPAKNKGPERVTSKAWKHKGSRKVNEHIRLETVVEETLAEMDSLLITERAKNPYAIGMAQAMKSSGDKPPLKKSTINKAHEIAKKIDESVINPASPALQAICGRYGKECKDFMSNGLMDQDLYHALHDHYYDDMPASVKRGGDTQQWVEDQFMSDIHGTSDNATMDMFEPDQELDELAMLAGIGGGRADESKCNMTAEGEYCPEHGLAECGGMMYEGKKAKKDYDGDGKIESEKDEVIGSRRKAAGLDESVLDECGIPMTGGMDEQDGMSVSTSVDTRTGRKTINISADGDTAEEIAQLLKMAGMAAHNEVHGEVEAQVEQPQVGVMHVAEEWANKAEVDYEDVDAITTQGGDLNKKKKQDPKTANKAANPLKENEVVDRLHAMFAQFKKV